MMRKTLAARIFAQLCWQMRPLHGLTEWSEAPPIFDKKQRHDMDWVSSEPYFARDGKWNDALGPPSPAFVISRQTLT